MTGKVLYEWILLSRIGLAFVALGLLTKMTAPYGRQVKLVVPFKGIDHVR